MSPSATPATQSEGRRGAKCSSMSASATLATRSEGRCRHNFLTHNLLTQDGRGRCGTCGTGLALVARLVPCGRRGRCSCWRGRGGTYGTGLGLLARLVPLRVACVALGDIDFHFSWQVWHLWHWAGSGGTLGSQWTPWSPRLLACQAWHLATSTSTLCRERATWWHRPALCVARVALSNIDFHFAIRLCRRRRHGNQKWMWSIRFCDITCKFWTVRARNLWLKKGGFVSVLDRAGSTCFCVRKLDGYICPCLIWSETFRWLCAAKRRTRTLRFLKKRTEGKRIWIVGLNDGLSDALCAKSLLQTGRSHDGLRGLLRPHGAWCQARPLPFTSTGGVGMPILAT